MIDLTQSRLALFIGGQIEIQNLSEGYLLRGEITGIQVRDEELHIALEWMARKKGHPATSEEWVMDDRREYVMNLRAYTPRDMGAGAQGGGSRLALDSSPDGQGEIVVLHPCDGSRIELASVKSDPLVKG